MQENLSEASAKIMWNVFQWAYRNDIEVSFYKNRRFYPDMHGDRTYPNISGKQSYLEGVVIRFTRGGKHFQQVIDRLDDLGPIMEYQWRRIGVELCVDPLI